MRAIILLTVINALFIFIVGNKLKSGVDNEYNATSCLLNQQHWNLIKWYFERCTFIEVTEIALNQSHKSKFSNQLTKGLMSGNGKCKTKAS